MKKELTLLFIIFFFMHLGAQKLVDFNHYTPLKCEGRIPEDFKAELSKMIDQAKVGGTDVNIQKQKQELEFAEISGYSLNNILYSGKVLYGDRLTNYANEVADNVLKKEPELRKKLRFYVLRNASPNAQTLQMGVIFFNIGLLAQIETEAQLAYIICHEAVHFRNKHGMERYARQQELVSRKNRYRNNDDKLKNLLYYSKAHELEADEEGLEIFLNSSYNSGDLNSLFDVMLYSYLPFDEIAFGTSCFNPDSLFVMPENYFIKEVKKITAKDDVPDSMSTHPNIQKRRLAIQKLLENRKQVRGLSFVHPKEEFQVIQRTARCEVAIAHLEEGEYEEAFYVGYLLEKKYKKTMFSDEIICASLYAISKQKSYYESLALKRGQDKEIQFPGLSKTINFWELIEGESQAVFYFFHKIPAKELSILATRKMYECYQLYNEKFFQLRFKNLVSDLVDIHGLRRDLFIKSISTDDSTEIKSGRMSRSSAQNPPKYYHYAFIPYYFDSVFRESFNFFEDKKEELEKRHADINYIAYSKERDKMLNKYGEGLNIDTFVLINPVYSNIVFRYIYFDTMYYVYRIKNPEFRPLQEVEIENKLISYTRQYANELNLELEVIGGNQPANIETDVFNNFQQMIRWTSERVSLGEMNAFIYHDQFIESYASRYGYLGFLYVANVYNALELHFVLFDLTTGEAKLVYSQELRRCKGDSVQVRMMIYEIMHRIKQDSEKLNDLKKKYGIYE